SSSPSAVQSFTATSPSRLSPHVSSKRPSALNRAFVYSAWATSLRTSLPSLFQNLTVPSLPPETSNLLSGLKERLCKASEKSPPAICSASNSVRREGSPLIRHNCSDCPLSPVTTAASSPSGLVTPAKFP